MSLKTKSGLERIDVAFEIKALHEDDDEFFVFEGLASTFGNLDLVKDIMMPGAFKESIAKHLPVILWQHNSNEPIGMPIEIKETIQGLFVKVQMPKADHFVSGRVMPQLRIGSITTMSIGFHVLKQEIDNADPEIRRILEVDLKEISLVTFAANPQAVITDVKALLDKTEMSDKDKTFLLDRIQEKQITVDDVKNITTVREYEKALRDVGFSGKAAEWVASNKFVESLRGEPADDEDELKNALASIICNLDNTMAASEISKLSLKVSSHERSIKRTEREN